MKIWNANQITLNIMAFFYYNKVFVPDIDIGEGVHAD